MYAGPRRRSSNVRVMQIFHELKAQFPTIPDHIITSCIASHVTPDSRGNLHEQVIAAAAKEHYQMGRPSIKFETPPFIPTPVSATKEPHVEPSKSAVHSQPESNRGNSGDMNLDLSNDVALTGIAKQQLATVSATKSEIPNSVAKRPNTLDIQKTSDPNERRLQPSEKCRDVHKLLNSPILADKPPRSPLSTKRFSSKPVPRKESPITGAIPKKETVSTPTQTTDTLVNNAPISSPSLNLSVNVNCQMGLIQSPVKPRCTTRLDLTPTQPWLSPIPSFSDVTSPRSFTSVNLTLRPPTSTPQDPIDITSQNSSLTYSTSSFDKEKGLQSRLQITVGPGNAGSVSSLRTRPRSFHSGENHTETVPNRTGSLCNLNVVSTEVSPVLLKQQARIDHLKIELQTGNARLVIMREEVRILESKQRQIAERRTTEELERQLKREIKHLTFQCEELASLLENGHFYNNLYTGPMGPLIEPQQPRFLPNRQPSTARRQSGIRQNFPPQLPPFLLPEAEGPKWNCSLCTFLNHPDLVKCEQCDMPRGVYHGTTVLSDVVVDGVLSPNQAPNRRFKSLPHSRSALTTEEMLRSLRVNDNLNNATNAAVKNVKANKKVPLNASVSAPNGLIRFSSASGHSNV